MWNINILCSLDLCKVVFYFYNLRRKSKPTDINMVPLLGEGFLILVGKY